MDDPPQAHSCSSGQACPRMGEAGDARAPRVPAPGLVHAALPRTRSAAPFRPGRSEGACSGADPVPSAVGK